MMAPPRRSTGGIVRANLINLSVQINFFNFYIEKNKPVSQFIEDAGMKPGSGIAAFPGLGPDRASPDTISRYRIF